MMISEVKNILAAWDGLSWRHHGAGMLQAYMPDGRRRVHIWDKSLLKEGMENGGAKHNHRFHLKSLIISGTLLHTELIPTQNMMGDHQLWRIEGASNRAEASLIPEGRVEVCARKAVRYKAGQSYALLKWDYHWGRQSVAESITITLVDMIDKEGSAGAPGKDEGKWARILCPVGVTPVHAFEDSEEEGDEVIRNYGGIVDAAHLELVILSES